ncbi:MAG: acyltransferase family protein [Lachnospiraceae bacterium]|nr:acyltransferase family protein [Lachnospiraceae bacterium]
MAKAVVACCLAAIHVFVECTPDEVLDSFGVPYIFDSILGGPLAAPMFMFCMGIGLTYSRDRSPKHLFKRGVIILVMGLLLNTLRYLIPSLIGYHITGDYGFYISPLPYKFFGNDIWQFAGLAHILMSLMLYADLSPFGTLNIAFVLNAIGMIFLDFECRYDAVNIILGHFIGVGGEGRIYSDFPLLIWFPIYAGGFAYGNIMNRVKDEDRFYSMITLPCLVVPIAFMFTEYFMGVGMMGGDGVNVFYHMNLGEELICIILVIGMMGIYHFLQKNMSKKVIGLIEKISRSLMDIYFFQWVLVWWAVDFFVNIIQGSRYMDWPQALVLGVILSFLSVVIGVWWADFVKRFHK